MVIHNSKFIDMVIRNVTIDDIVIRNVIAIKSTKTVHTFL